MKNAYKVQLLSRGDSQSLCQSAHFRLTRFVLAVLTTAVVFHVAAAGGWTADPQRLRVLSYNIHHGEGIDGRLDLARIAQVIRSVEPDIVALQEVDQNVPRSGSLDQPAALADMLKMEVAFGKNIDLNGGAYGNAVLSRLPIERHTNHLLPRLDDGEQRGVLEVEIAVPGSQQPLRVLATHLDHRRPNAERLASVEAIAGIVGESREQAALLIGDMNDVPGSGVLKQLELLWTRPHQEVFLTSPSREPRRQIDFIFYRPSDRWKAIETKVLDEPIASDHRPIFAVLEMESY